MSRCLGWLSILFGICEEKIASRDIPPCLFVVYPESQNARKYNFKVCKQYREEEKKLACARVESLKLEASCSIKEDLCIWDLSIAWRLRWRDKNQRIASSTRKLWLLRDDSVIYTKRTVDSATRLNNQVFVRESEHFICHAKFKAVDHLSDWIAYNDEGLSYFCDLTSCDLP